MQFFFLLVFKSRVDLIFIFLCDIFIVSFCQSLTPNYANGHILHKFRKDLEILRRLLAVRL